MKVEMHMHTYRSDDGLITPREVKAIIDKGKVDMVCITDHNHSDAWNEFKGLPAIMGIEKTIREENGNKFHLLIYFIDSPISSRDFGEVIDSVREQDAFCAIAHPFDRWRKAPSNLDLYAKRVDALEALNARTLYPFSNASARKYAQAHNMRMIAGSDAHHYSEIGNAYVECEAGDGEEFRKMLRKGRVSIKGGMAMPHVHLFSTLKKHKILTPKL
ncbi:MAG: PHP domain-containing protein [Candidatus Micrarchaeota archaeon]|nr:PHP domain-containing protein [Candidatus Micrarchaeota archaeon]